MGVVGSNILAGSSGAAEAYTIDQSLRFNDDDSAYLSKTFTGTPTLSTKATISLWWKRGGIGDTGVNGGEQTLISWNTGLGNRAFLRSEGGTDQLSFNIINDSGTYGLNITPVQRDVSAWYHIVGVIDTTQVTSTNRMKLYINGEQVTAFDSSSYPAQDETNIGFGEAEACNIGRDVKDSNTPLDGYLAEFYFIDGTALDASSFGETDTATNQWIPIDASGLTFGTNGFYQKYAGTMDGYTKLLLHCDGANDGTTFTDSSPSAHTMTANGDAHTDTTVKKFGTASLQLDGNDSVSTPDSADFAFGDGDWTVEAWLYADTVSEGQDMFYQQYDSDNHKFQMWRSGTSICFHARSGGTHILFANTPSSVISVDTWHHVAVSSSSKTVKIFIDGVSQSLTVLLGANPYSGSMPDVGSVLGIGGNGNEYTQWQGYLDEVRVSKGIARYTADFTVAAEPFGDTSIGADSSGNDNDFAVTNLVATDQMPDTPTNNFCTITPLAYSNTLSEGNLEITGTSTSWFPNPGTIGMSSGKWYWEFTITALSGNTLSGILEANSSDQEGLPGGGTATGYGYHKNGSLYTSPSTDEDDWGATYTTGDIMGVALNMDDGTLTFYKNNATQGVAATGLTATYLPSFSPFTTGTTIVTNFGQDSSFAGAETAQGNQDSNGIGDFYYEPPTDHLALCTSNLASPEIALPTAHFNTKLYTGDGATTLAVTGVGFQPDFTWIKNRSATDHHVLVDSVRGATKYLVSNDTGPEVDDSTFVASLDSDGFTVGDDVVVNTSTENYVSWNWLAGGTAVSNTDGSITSSVSANTDAGFSIVSWTAEGAIDTIGHGLSQKPELIIIKDRDGADESWVTGADPIGWTKYLTLNSDAAENTSSSVFNDTSPSSSVFTVSDGFNDTQPIITYCFHSVEGYSKVGSYEGNGNADGPFIYTGFKPAWILVKNATVNTQWDMWDNKRDTYNLMNHLLQADNSSARITSAEVDFVSDGFKVRSASDNMNDSGETLVYLAFAESPFKYSNAR